MKYSKTQIDLWRAKEEIARDLAAMNWDQRREYYAEALLEFEQRTGVHLKVASRGPSSRLARTA